MSSFRVCLLLYSSAVRYFGSSHVMAVFLYVFRSLCLYVCISVLRDLCMPFFMYCCMPVGISVFVCFVLSFVMSLCVYFVGC